MGVGVVNQRVQDHQSQEGVAVRRGVGRVVLELQAESGEDAQYPADLRGGLPPLQFAQKPRPDSTKTGRLRLREPFLATAAANGTSEFGRRACHPVTAGVRLPLRSPRAAVPVRTNVL